VLENFFQRLEQPNFKLLPLTLVLPIVGLDIGAISSGMSRPEIGLHKKVNLWTLKNKPSMNILTQHQNN
jgi:hypothetical protein